MTGKQRGLLHELASIMARVSQECLEDEEFCNKVYGSKIFNVSLDEAANRIYDSID